MSVTVFYLVVVAILGILAASGIRTSYTVSRKDGLSRREWAKRWYADFSTELAGAFVATLLLGLLLLFVQQGEEEQQLKAYLIGQLRSGSHDVTLGALNELKVHGWLYDGSLQNADLSGSNLENADLSRADLVSTNLENANLQNADLNYANLSSVDLTNANLLGAGIAWAVVYQPLTQTYGINTESRGGEFSETTRLPDGQFWTPETDLRKFTDPDHPDFWRSNHPLSPAYSRNRPSGNG